MLVRVFSLLAALAAVGGLGLFASSIGDANGAPQQAALSAMVLAGVVPPYILARCLEMISTSAAMESKDAVSSLERQKAEVEKKLAGLHK